MPSVVATLQALVVELRATIAEQRATITQLQERVRDLETRVGQHSGNSSRPPSSDLPGTPKGPPYRPSGRGRGGQPGHVAHQRAMAPPGRVDVVTDRWPRSEPGVRDRPATDTGFARSGRSVGLRGARGDRIADDPSSHHYPSNPMISSPSMKAVVESGRTSFDGGSQSSRGHFRRNTQIPSGSRQSGG